MTQNQNTEPAPEPQDDGDSAVMKALRKQIKDLEAELKSTPSRDDIIAEYEAARQRTEAVKGELVAKGVPAGVAELVENKLGESEITAEAVSKVLTDLGFQVEEGQGVSGEGAEQGSRTGEALAGVTQLGTQVRAAAEGGAAASPAQRIAAAKSREELAAVTAELGIAAGPGYEVQS